MKEEYITPEAEFIVFETEDVITTSGEEFVYDVNELPISLGQ